jgi:hypothetical protein
MLRFFFAWALYLAGELVSRSRPRICKFERHPAPTGFPACPVTSILQGGDRHRFILAKTRKRRIDKVLGRHGRRCFLLLGVACHLPKNP